MAMATLQKQIQTEAYRLVFSQFALLSLTAFFSLFLFNSITASSLWLGGLCYILPNFLFVYSVFRFAAPQDVYAFLAAFLGGEVFKIILSAILMILVVKWMPLGLSSVIAGFILAIVFFWVVCFIHFSKRKGVKA
jgi:F0F1-type ATP synthase assembly protein I